MMQTIRDPMLLPCGHIGDKESLVKMKFCRHIKDATWLICSFDRERFDASQLVSMKPKITHLFAAPSNPSSPPASPTPSVSEPQASVSVPVPPEGASEPTPSPP